jgi:hypothetical protein
MLTEKLHVAQAPYRQGSTSCLQTGTAASAASEDCTATLEGESAGM